MAGVGQSPTGAAANRADRIADGRRDHSGLSLDEKALQWFDTSAYSVPAFVDASATRPTRQFGTAGIGTVVGPSFFTFDAIAQKNFHVAERYKLQVRVEVFNPFNAVMLGNPDMNASSPNFGRIRTSNPNTHNDSWVAGDEDGKTYLEQHLRHDQPERWQPLFVTGDPLWTSYTVSARVRPLSLAESAGIVFRYHT